MEMPPENKKRIGQALLTLLIILSAYFAVKIIYQLKQVSLLGGSATPATISFSGHGEVTAVADIATVYFTISKDAATIKDAQAGIASIEKKALDVLKAKGVADKDIKTTDASAYPKYEYQQGICPQAPMSNGAGGMVSPSYCPPGRSVINGYTASESITVKVRKTDDVSAIMQGLGAAGVSNLSGPSFSIENEDALKGEARKKAIDDARGKAEALAKDLGVSLGKISAFSEGGNYPIYYAKDSMAGSGTSEAPVPAQLPKGENTITSDVTITYEIK
jgi:uncharacterized protein YggE